MTQQDYPFEPEPVGVLSLPVRLFWCCVFFGPAAYFGYQGDTVLAALMSFAGIGAFSGYRVGALSILTCFAAFAAAIAYAPGIGIDCEQKVQELLGTTGLLNRAISVVAVAILLSLVVWLITHFTLGRIIRNRPRADQCNRVTGFAFGLAQGTFAIVLFLGGMLMLAPIQKQRLEDQGLGEQETSGVHRFVFWADAQVDQSVVGPYLRQYNPIEKIPQLNHLEEVQRTANVLADPSKLDDVMRHPSIEELRERPDVRRAVETLRQDEEVQQILTSGEPMTRNAVMTLLSHPALLELVDQPGFLEQASKAIEDVGL